MSNLEINQMIKMLYYIHEEDNYYHEDILVKDMCIWIANRKLDIGLRSSIEINAIISNSNDAKLIVSEILKNIK